MRKNTLKAFEHEGKEFLYTSGNAVYEFNGRDFVEFKRPVNGDGYYKAGYDFAAFPDFKKLHEPSELLKARLKPWLLQNSLPALRSLSTHSIGTDPEVFVEVGGQVLPAWEFLPAKNKAMIVNADARFVGDVWPTMQGANQAQLFWDGFQAEFRVKEGGCLEQMVDRIRLGLREILRAAKKKNPAAKLSLKSVATVDSETMYKLPLEYVELGCAVSRNAYGLAPMELDDPRTLLHRFTGGHIHLGDGQLLKNPKVEHPALVRFLDRTIGLMTTSMFESFDDPVRRKYYGLPGEYRSTNYGVEYRVLSNAWLAHPAIAHLVLDTARRLTMLYIEGVGEMLFPEDAGEQKEVFQVIVECDGAGARALLNRRRDEWYAVNRLIWGRMEARMEPNGVAKISPEAVAAMIRYADKATHKGIESVIKDPADFEHNWSLEGKWELNSRNLGAEWCSGTSVLQTGKLL